VIFLAGLVPLKVNLILLSETNLQLLKKVKLKSFAKDCLTLKTNRVFLIFMLVSFCCVGILIHNYGFYFL
jgi:DHA1 family bicyclomycin/chloramphenicol resistance-like MFS transporter